MKKILVLSAITVFALALAAQAQDNTTPPVQVSGSAQTVASIVKGDPTTNGSAIVGALGISFSGTSNDLNAVLTGKGKVSVDVTGWSSSDTNSSTAGFTGDGKARTKLDLGPTGSGNVTLSAALGGNSISTQGDCTTGNCAGGSVGSNAAVNLNLASTTGGTLGLKAILSTSGATWASNTPNESAAVASVSATAKAKQVTQPPPSGN